MIDRATQTQIDDPAAAGGLWAEIDRAIVAQAPYVWLVNPIAIELSSPSEWTTTSTASCGAAFSISCRFGSESLGSTSAGGNLGKATVDPNSFQHLPEEQCRGELTWLNRS
jgi:hypothetical protein